MSRYLRLAEKPDATVNFRRPSSLYILNETVLSIGLLQRQPNSYLCLDPAWKPAPPIASEAGQFAFADLLKFAGVA